MYSEEFQDDCHGDHPWYQSETILAYLKLHVIQRPPTKFQFNGLINCLWRISRWLPSLVSKWNDFSNSESQWCFVWYDSIHPSQQFLSYVGKGLTRLNQYLARINVSFSRIQCSDACEAPTRNPSVSSQALYHWATELPNLHDALITATKLQFNPTYGKWDVIWRIYRWLTCLLTKQF